MHVNFVAFFICVRQILPVGVKKQFLLDVFAFFAIPLNSQVG